MAYSKAYYEAHKKEILERNRQYYLVHKPYIRLWNNAYQMRRCRNDSPYKLRRSLRRRFLLAISGIKKSSPVLKLLGCSIDAFKTYIESKFLTGMTWINHGQWHLDHIIPCVRFNLAEPAQQAACFHYTNFQPLWGEDNLKKGALCGTNPRST